MTDKHEDHRMLTPFDLTAEHNREIQPHIDAIFQKCKELDIPCLIAVCHQNQPREDGKGTENGISLAVNFCGPSKTPPTFVVSAIAIEEGPLAAIEAALSLGVSKYRSEEVKAEAAPVN